MGIYDLESNPLRCNPGPVDWVHYHVPRAMLDTFTDDAEASRIQTLQCTYGRVDPVLHQMTELMLPSVDSPQSFSAALSRLFPSPVLRARGPHLHAPSVRRPTRVLVAVSRRPAKAPRD